ncbi:colorectal cancer-associated protein 2, partial [Corapipo altera]|uniref:colorectal cancer-associated protein 2 n=1 Tax=Corapipo altera TaxID=415028 RepID=UPI000FD67999
FAVCSPFLQSVFPQTLSGKPKVYQGVRVKITVKELLQQRRARQAATGSAVSKNILLFALSLLCLFSFFFFFLPRLPGSITRAEPNRFSLPTAGLHITSPAEPTQERVSGGRAGGYLGELHKVSWGSSSSIQFSESVSPPHPAPFDAEPISSVPNCCPSWQFSNCLSCEESPSYLEQLIDSCLQSDVPSEPACSAFQPSHYTPDTFQPVPLCFNQGLAASPPSSADLPSPVNHSCSPAQLSPLTPLTPSPPPALDTRTYSCPGEECTDCLDYLPPLAMAEDFFRRDRSWDICYS